MLENIKGIDNAIRMLFGDDCLIEQRRPVGGGDINESSLLDLSNGGRVFLKENRRELSAMFAAEALGLQTLGSVSERSDSPPVPTPLAWGTEGSIAFLMMEEVVSGHSVSGEAFGHSLAELHKNGRSTGCGFDADNWIGTTPQHNGKLESWIDFFAERRLSYQWELATRAGFGDSKTHGAMDRLLSSLDRLLPPLDSQGASLLHGDLWGGNWMASTNGKAFLIDPAVYYGHREADLAMTELFGGFPSGFRNAYSNAWPLEPGFNERKDIYNLYHLLNHLNLFGASYWGSVRSTLMKYS